MIGSIRLFLSQEREAGSCTENNSQNVSIDKLMQCSGVKFGTSGARGLADDITDLVAYCYTKAFLQHLDSIQKLREKGTEVAIGGDLRPSTMRIMQAAARAISDMGFTPLSFGRLPSPALAYYGFENKIPTVMVTGSHIPEDRNGIKYTTAAGEITKKDETGIKAQSVHIPCTLFNDQGMFLIKPPQLQDQETAAEQYVQRYIDAFPAQLLCGKRIGVYEHSAVGRDLLTRLYTELGAEVVSLGRSDTFVPVDTEAIREEDCLLAAEWARTQNLDTIVSTDGDSDRPLVSDEHGKWVRGDVSGILTASFLGANAVATPVSCNTALEKSGRFSQIVRTRIGSPFVIAGMEQAIKTGANAVVGYEANGGFLLGTDVQVQDNTLKALPTRDAVIVHLALLCLSIQQNQPISKLLAKLPQRFTKSDRLKEFPTQRSAEIISALKADCEQGCLDKIEAVFLSSFGKVKSVDATDGLRITFSTEEMVHLRPSGNAPEFRCYTEAASEARAQDILDTGIMIMQRWRTEVLQG